MEHYWATTTQGKGALVDPPPRMEGYVNLQCKEARLKGPQTIYMQRKTCQEK